MTGVLDFYRNASPRGIPIKKFATWTNASVPSMVFTPGASQAYFIKSLGFVLDKLTDFGSNTLSVIHSSDVFGGVESTSLSFSSVDNLIAGFSPGTPKELSCQIKGHIVFEVPILLKNSLSQTLTVSFSGSGLTSGGLYIGGSGWYIPEADL